MLSIKFNDKNEQVVREINQLIEESNHILNESALIDDIITFKAEIDSWRNNTIRVLNRSFSDDSIGEKFSMETIYFLNKLSKQDTIYNLNESIKKGYYFLQLLKNDIKEGLYEGREKCQIQKMTEENIVDKRIAVEITRRILNNFYKHIQSMYHEKVHGKSTIKQEDLSNIQMGNEYDVQRILYSLIRPIFPEARLEVSEDAGYKSIRYDIFIDEYDMVIEVKCTRSNMNERQLTEELGADAFHYKAEYLFLFIFDKENIIKNMDAFIKGHRREKRNFGKEVEVIIIQPVML